MNILILTSIHPVDITEIGQILYSSYDKESVEIFSIQAMSLLAESIQENKNSVTQESASDLKNKSYYLVNNQLFTTIIEKNSSYLRKNLNKKHLIVYGNLSKNTNIKFDYIISFKQDYSEDIKNFDPYLDKTKSIFKEQPLSWYNRNDCEYHFYEKKHLLLFLKNILK